MLLSLFLISLSVGLNSATWYSVTVKTSSLAHSGTDSAIDLKILGERGAVSSQLDNSGHNDFQTGHTDKYSLQLGEVMLIQGLELSIRGSDAFLFDWVSVRSQTFRETRYFYNVKKQVLSGDLDEGVTKVTLSFQGDMTYTVTTVTGTVANAGSSSIGLSMMLEGENGEFAYTSYIDPKEGSFKEGVFDEFVLGNMPDMGTVKCVTLKADESDAWYFDVIAVEKKGGRPVLFENTYQTFLSADSSEGMTSMKLCA
ncbi:uncharacterized protein LOC134820855 [Bolinopsis microptera]|uniref:uncharacterized protein LOC134820855 n=1 Tax=Bolinopsis microptera TaxID=2820187 RepID=UPI003079D2EB